MTGVYVPDLSNNNGSADSIDFGAMARGGMAGVILKATEGTGFVDPRFGVWALQAHNAGLPVAGYHFGHPEEDVASQVGLFERTIASAGVPIAFRMADVEIYAPGAQVFANGFCPAALVKLLYSGSSFANTAISQPIPGVEWLIADYGPSSPPPPPWGKEAGWQFSQTASVPGVPGPSDCSLFDPAAFAALISGGSVPQANEVTGAFVPPAGHPNFGSAWDVTWSGGVLTKAGKVFYGSYGSLPPQAGARNFPSITARPNGAAGYTIWGNDGSFYTFGPSAATETTLGVQPCVADDHLGNHFEFEVPAPSPA